MKNLLLALLSLIWVFEVHAQNDQYTNAMKGLLQKMSAAKSPEAYQAVANGFERIASNEKTQWHPRYNAAFCYVMQAMSITDKDKIDPIVDQAEKLLEDAAQINLNDEILCLQSLCKSARIGVNPMTRGMKYGPESAKLLAQAREMNPNNPRVYYLEGQSKFYTPEAFGGSKKKAKELFEQALTLFANFKPTTDLIPNWGEDQVKKMIEEAGK